MRAGTTNGLDIKVRHDASDFPGKYTCAARPSTTVEEI